MRLKPIVFGLIFAAIFWLVFWGIILLAIFLITN